MCLIKPRYSTRPHPRMQKMKLALLILLLFSFKYVICIAVDDDIDEVPIILEDAAGNAITAMYVSIRLDEFVEVPEWELHESESWINVSYIPMHNVILPGMELPTSVIRTDYVNWVDGTGKCLDTTSGLPLSVWNMSFNIWQHLSRSDCSMETGRAGYLYWKFWTSGGDCKGTADPKTIFGAVMGMMERVLNGLICTNYCISLTQGGTWYGNLILGPTSAAWTSSCVGVYSGDWIMGCGSLDWPCSSWN